MSDVDNPPKVLAVTSSNANEGKTTIAMALATSAAQSQLRALLIDADLRHAAASRYFGAAGRVGLVDYLVEGAKLSDAIVRDDRFGLFVLPSGCKTQNPGDLLDSDRFKALIAELRRQFDLG